MKAIVNKDPRPAIDRKWDEMFERLVRDASLNPKQRAIVRAYVRDLLSLKIHEIEGAVEMSYIYSLVEVEHFGVDSNRGAKRLRRVQARATEVLNDAYGKDCFDGMGRHLSYDGCGYEHLQTKLESIGITYEGNV